MIQKIKNYLMIAALAFMPVFAVAVPATVSAADRVCGSGTIGEGLSKGANGAATGSGPNCTQGTGVDDTSITRIGRQIVNLISIIIGIIAIIMIIFGGFRYITSGGDSGKVGNAKNTLIYAIIGLIIVALAQVIVHFVLNQTNNAIT